MSTLNSRNGWGGNFTSGETGEPASRSGGAAGQGQVWRPEHAKSQTHTAIQVVTTATVHRDDGFELDEYAADSKRHAANDVENYPRAGTAVQLPGVASKTAISDETSMHSRTSFDAK
ncbi:hypothetical protein FRC06_003367 [Ceratobasidium sp. 370]|nr:hypothetical protein FRC06_003367 [Ceratobasidium sp. 370]